MGVTTKPAVVAKTAPKKRGRPVGSTKTPRDKPIDWEKLAKQLQVALASEIKENDALLQLVEEMKSVIRTDSSFTFWDRLVFLFSGKL
jgi:hypothetical protein